MTKKRKMSEIERNFAGLIADITDMKARYNGQIKERDERINKMVDNRDWLCDENKKLKSALERIAKAEFGIVSKIAKDAIEASG